MYHSLKWLQLQTKTSNAKACLTSISYWSISKQLKLLEVWFESTIMMMITQIYGRRSDLYVRITMIIYFDCRFPPILLQIKKHLLMRLKLIWALFKYVSAIHLHHIIWQTIPNINNSVCKKVLSDISFFETTKFIYFWNEQICAL